MSYLSRNQWTLGLFAGLLAVIFVSNGMFSLAGADREVEVTQCRSSVSGNQYELASCGTAEELDATQNSDIAYHTPARINWYADWHQNYLEQVKGFSGVDTGCYNEYRGFSICTDSKAAADYVKNNWPKSYDRSSFCPGDDECNSGASDYQYIIGVQGVSDKVMSRVAEQSSCTTTLSYSEDDSTAALSKSGEVSFTDREMVCLHKEAKTSMFSDSPSSWDSNPRLITGGEGVSFSFDADFSTDESTQPDTGNGDGDDSVNDNKGFFEKIWVFIKSLLNRGR